MGRVLLIATLAVTIFLLAIGTLNATKVTNNTGTPEGAVRSTFENIQAGNWQGAYSNLANHDGVSLQDFVRSLKGSDGDLRTFSSLSKVNEKVLHANDKEALVRTGLEWSTAVGAVYDSKDLRVVRDGNAWKVDWPVEKKAKVPPQVIPVSFLRWDVVTRGADDDWGAQNVDAPRVRIVSMNAVEHEGGTTILGEIVNEDTVPGFVSVNAYLVGKDGKTLGEESSFDKISHVLLPKEVSPFRVDFPHVPLRQIKSVRMQPNTLLVPASADPMIGVLNQKLATSDSGHKVLQGQLLNESGHTVNIPHVLATFYDNQGRVIWVSDGYVDKALLPETPENFSVAVSDDVASKVQSFRVSVNSYSINSRDEM